MLQNPASPILTDINPIMKYVLPDTQDSSVNVLVAHESTRNAQTKKNGDKNQLFRNVTNKNLSVMFKSLFFFVSCVCGIRGSEPILRPQFK